MTNQQSLDVLGAVRKISSAHDILSNVLGSLDVEDPATEILLAAGRSILEAGNEINRAVKQSMELQPTLKTA